MRAGIGRCRSVVAARAAARGDLNGGLRADLERRERGLLPDLLRDDLVERDRHIRTLGRRVRMLAGEPSRGVVGVHGTEGSEVLEIVEGRDVLLVWFERGQRLAELEVRALARGAPRIEFLAVGRVVHDRPVRDVEEPRTK